MTYKISIIRGNIITPKFVTAETEAEALGMVPESDRPGATVTRVCTY
jgi:hypothetical protein